MRMLTSSAREEADPNQNTQGHHQRQGTACEPAAQFHCGVEGDRPDICSSAQSLTV